MIRKYHNHKLQTTLWHRKEEPLNHHETPGRQTKQSNQLKANLIVVYYGTLRKVEKLTCDTLINRFVHAIIGPRRNKVENEQGLEQTHCLLLKVVYLEMIKDTHLVWLSEHNKSK